MTTQPTADQPMQVHEVSAGIKGWLDKLGTVWVEGELTSFQVRGGHAYAKLRDLNEDVSLSLVVWRSTLAKLTEQFQQGDRVMVFGKIDFWVKGGTLSLQVMNMRHAGLGNLLEQLRKLAEQLAAEGLFATERKQPLPFLPQCIGLITGKDSDAEKDVRRNAELRWPAVQFRTIHTRVQGEGTAEQVITALETLDADPEVDVIIIARGGGDFMHLLPFSDETLVRAAAAASTPIVSAIGHENDRPLLDEVADLRASTPTDAAKRVVPDTAEQLDLVTQLRARLRRRVTEQVVNETRQLAALRSRPVLAEPSWIVDRHGEELMRLAARGEELVRRQVDSAERDLAALTQRLSALSPEGTLRRGYAIVERQRGDESVIVTNTDQVRAGDALSIRVTDGRIEATVE
ncbi:exodeoxyribonuclease VII large subunit [uncultured Gulosibacter sp.]|uniref:exodeoxyribonuclease VII large subunit n=1 Tax=uncultured Gulosibacter sp. TaxID=1339167 RepID=UPI00288C3CC4|nr:exodeoxyribonuclease VII large subunit [uncultured Gulosibacter sp.]